MSKGKDTRICEVLTTRVSVVRKEWSKVPCTPQNSTQWTVVEEVRPGKENGKVRTVIRFGRENEDNFIEIRPKGQKDGIITVTVVNKRDTKNV